MRRQRQCAMAGKHTPYLLLCFRRWHVSSGLLGPGGQPDGRRLRGSEGRQSGGPANPAPQCQRGPSRGPCWRRDLEVGDMMSRMDHHCCQAWDIVLSGKIERAFRVDLSRLQRPAPVRAGEPPARCRVAMRHNLAGRRRRAAARPPHGLEKSSCDFAVRRVRPQVPLRRRS
jgi:hypothetical protein